MQIVLAGVYHADVPPGNIPLAAVESLRGNPLIAQVIPLSLGDSFQGYRIVGTEPEFITHYDGVLAQGEVWMLPLDAVLGSEVARTSKLRAGDKFVGSHGLAEGGGTHADSRYTVTGVLAPTGTVLDRLVLTSLDSVWAVHERHHDDDDRADRGVHGNGVDAKGAAAHSIGAAQPAPAAAHSAAEPAREVTLALVKYRTPLAAASLPRMINRDTELVAASPAYETARLLTVFGAGVDLIRAFAWILVAASTLMLFVALSQVLEERRYDLAIMRTLGASRGQVATVLLYRKPGARVTRRCIGIGRCAHCGRRNRMVAPASGTAGRVGTPVPAGRMAGRRACPRRGYNRGTGPAWRAYRLDVAATLAEG